MASLKEIRARIGSVRSNHKITSAMKMVAAAKLHKAEEKALQFSPYKDELTEVLGRYLGAVAEEQIQIPLAQERVLKNVTLVAISSDSGMCGAFNANIGRMLSARVQQLHKQGLELQIYTVGKKVADYAKRQSLPHDTSYIDLTNKPDYERSSNLASFLAQQFLSGATDRVEMLYNHYKSVGSQIPTNDCFLPLPVVVEKAGNGRQSLYLTEPTPAEFINALMPLVVRVRMYAALIDSSAGECGARTTAMQIASDNAEKLLGELTQQYNRARQEVITNELIDIVGGAEALR